MPEDGRGMVQILSDANSPREIQQAHYSGASASHVPRYRQAFIQTCQLRHGSHRLERVLEDLNDSLSLLLQCLSNEFNLIICHQNVLTAALKKHTETLCEAKKVVIRVESCD